MPAGVVYFWRGSTSTGSSLQVFQVSKVFGFSLVLMSLSLQVFYCNLYQQRWILGQIT